MNEWNKVAAEIVDWLISTSWQAAVLAVLVVAVQWIFRRKLTARWRYLLWFLVVGRLLIPSLPESPTSVYRYVPSSPASAMVFEESPPLSVPFQAVTSPVAGLSEARDAAQLTIPIKTILLGIWVGGVLALMAVLMQRNARFHSGVFAHSELAGESVQMRAQLIAAEMKLRRAIPVIETDFLETPAAVGLFNPTLLLPRGLALRLADEELGLIFRHEIAHLKRGDLWTNLLTSLLQIFHWFNPVLWWAFRRMHDDRELATDALALSFSAKSRLAYGETLLKFVSGELKRVPLSPSIGILENRQHLRERLEQISRLKPNAYAWSALGTILVVILSLLALTKAPAQVTNGSASVAVVGPSRGDKKDLLNLLKQILDTNAAALEMGCSVDSKWLYSSLHGAKVFPNSERTSNVAVKGDHILSDLWVSAEYDATSQKMAPTTKNEYLCAFNGENYIARDWPRSYLVSQDHGQMFGIYDALSSYPLTQMFAFLVPRQGWVSYGNLVSSSIRDAYLGDIQNVAYDPLGNLVVTTVRADRIRQEVTFSVAHHFYPSKIVMDWDNKTNGLNPAVWGTSGESITEVVDWFQTNLFGKDVEFLPKSILCRNGVKGNLQPCWEIHVYPNSLRPIPDNPHFFDLPIPSGAEVTEEPSMKSRREP